MKLKVNLNEKPYWLVLDLEEKLLAKDLVGLLQAESGKMTEPSALFVDGHYFEPETLLAECRIFEGSTIALSTPQIKKSKLILATTSGLESGKWVELGKQNTIIGRSQKADLHLDSPVISPRHLSAKVNEQGQVELLDLDSQNGMNLNTVQISDGAKLKGGNSRIQIGNSYIEVLETPTQNLPKSFGHIIYNRAPIKSDSSPQLAPLQIPQKKQTSKTKLSFSWATLIAPIIFGLVMAFLFSPYMAFFALLSPLMSVGSWLESKYRHRQSRIQLGQKQKRELNEFSKNLSAYRKAEMLGRQKRRLNPLAVFWSIQNGNGQLWERRPHHLNFLLLSFGSCDLKWQPEFKNETDKPLEAAQKMVEKLTPLLDIPFELAFEEKTILGILGPHHISASLARWLILQTIFLHRPSDLSIQYFGTYLPSDWEWLNWIPHFESNTEMAQLVLLDTFQNNLPAIPNLEATQKTLAIVLAKNFQDLPEGCTDVIQIKNNLGDAELLETKEPFKVDGISKDFATNCARYLARYKDFANSNNSLLPKEVKLGELLDLARMDLGKQILNWEKNSLAPKLEIPLGQIGQEILSLDIVSDGPHGLVAGTTGSGKSELLRTLVAGLAQKSSPEIINFVLIDFKGGSTFDMLSDLPHTVGMITDLNLNLGERALISLRTELTRREKILQSAKAEDLKDFYAKTKNATPLPRLLIVVDEFASMAEELPDFLNSLVEIARRGRSLGVHLILATQRPAGVVNSNILANTNFRICLRTLSEADSLDVIGCSDATLLPKDIPGRACLQIGMTPIRVFQAAQASSVTPKDLGPIALYPANSMAEILKANATDKTDIEKIVKLTFEAHRKLEMDKPYKPLADPLPKTLDISDKKFLPESSVINIGLLDNPKNQTLDSLNWEPSAGNLGLVGNKSCEWLLALTIVSAQQDYFDQIFVFDYGDNLKSLKQLSKCNELCESQDIELRNQMLGFLNERLKQKQGGKKILCVVNNSETLFGDLESEGNFSSLEQIDRLLYEGPSVGIHWMLGLNNISNSNRRIQKKTYMRIYAGLRASTDYLEAGIPFKTGLSFDPEMELLGDTGQEVKIMTCKNPEAFITQNLK